MSKGTLSGFRRTRAGIIIGVAILNVFLLLAVFRNWADPTLRIAPEDQCLLVFFSFIWAIVAVGIPHLFGISLRDDGLERRNLPALVVAGCSIFSVSLIYAGANIGAGPSIGENLFCALLGAIAFFLIWLLVELFARISVSISEERDPASAIRVGALLLCIGVVLARAVAGDWHSASATLRDFIHDGSFALLLALLAIPVERIFRPSLSKPKPGRFVHGAMPAFFYLLTSMCWLSHLGPWEGYHR